MTQWALDNRELTAPPQVRRLAASPRAFVAACVVLGLGLRAVLASLPRVLHGDEPSYLLIARSLAQGEGYLLSGRADLHYGPLLPWALSLPLRLWDNPEAASALVYVVAGALLVVPYYALARALYGHPAARLATLLLTIFPALTAAPLVSVSMTEPFYLLFLFSGLLCAWRTLHLPDGRVPWLAHAGMGLAFGLAYLTRPEASALIVLFTGLWLVWRIADGRWRQIRRWLGPLVGLAVFALLAAPYVEFLHHQTGRWMLSGKVQITFDIGTNVLRNDARGYDRAIAALDATGQDLIWFSDERFSADIVGELLSSPGALIHRLRRNWSLMAGALFSAQTLSPWLVALAGVGLFAEGWSRRRLQAELFLLVALLPLVTYLVFHVEARFLVAAYPVALLWIAAGLMRLAAWLADTARHAVGHELSDTTHTLAGVVPLALTVATLLLAMGGILGERALLPWDHKAAGAWLRQHAPPAAAIISRSPEISLYAHRRSLPSPNADWPEVADYARRNGATYYVADRRELTELRPQLALLADPDTVPDALALEQVIEGQYGQATYIFRFREAVFNAED